MIRKAKKPKQFIVRIELHDEQPGDYDILYNHMKNVGFSRTIEENGRSYHLPPGEYILVTDKTDRDETDIDVVLTQAQHAGQLTGKRYSMLVSAVSAVRTSGLNNGNEKSTQT